MADQEINWEIAVSVDHPHLRECARIGCCPSPSLIPNYCTDLNAMHEAEKTLHATNDWRILRAYFKWISPEIHEDWALTGDDWKLCHSTARQRAEAFLRTIGKWKGESK
jgi:hypothetical protein